MDNSGQQNPLAQPVIPAPAAPEPAPVAAPEPLAPQPVVEPTQPQPAASPTPEANKKTILLIEDDPLLVKMYSTKFTKEGFNVITAQDGEEGLRVATSQHFDFMILDVMMPKMSGIDMLTKLRSDPKYKAVPVIVLTNLTQKEEAVKVQSLDVKEYLVKANFTPSEVVAKVKQYLAQA